MNARSIAYFDEAIEALAQKPDKSTLFTAYYNRGFAHFRHRNYNRAVEDYTKALELSPDERKFISTVELLVSITAILTTRFATIPKR